ncbi:MAG: hypothetical protein HOV94_37315 [Saccharothrix sp.]|nr:hypothetical protein [Saccharothrix sp.]
MYWKDDRAAQTGDSLAGLLSAREEDEATGFYWKLENVVVVQGQLFEAAPAAVSVLLAGLAGPLSKAARGWALELLFQLVAGESDESAVERGNPDLGPRCRAVAREGLWLLYGLVGGPYDEEARQILERVDGDSGRLEALT